MSNTNINPIFKAETNQFRIDIKNRNTEKNDITITTKSKINKPSWFKDNTGQGYVIQGYTQKETIDLQIIKQGILTIYFKGIDKRKANVRIPIWTDYKSIKINGKEILSAPIATWHDKPYIYQQKVNDKQQIKIEFESTSHTYTAEELHNEILEFSTLYLKENINNILDDFYKTINLQDSSQTNNPSFNFWQLKTAIPQMPEAERKKAEKQYYQYLNTQASWIGLSSSFASEPITPHGLLGIFISGGARIGKNCVIFQHVTIGSNTLVDSKSNGAPTIGDNCYIGAGAKIIGKLKIGNNVRIGANAVVVTDIPDNSVVVLNKPKIIHKENMDNKFYHILNGQYGYHLDGKFFPIKK